MLIAERSPSSNDTFRYLRSLLLKDGDIDEDVSHKIKVVRLIMINRAGRSHVHN
jgi:hypothetical protein